MTYEENLRFDRHLRWLCNNRGPSRTHYIYTLSDPRTKQVHYVGQTNNPKERLSAHKTNGKRSLSGKLKLSPLNLWLGELASEGLSPKMDIYKKIKCENGVNCSPTCENANKAEKETYLFFKNKMKSPLLNEKEPD